MSDIDIDFANRDDILSLIDTIPARLETGKIHPSGRYVTSIPYDPKTGLSTIDYKQAEERGYYKIDFLNMYVYQLIKDYAHYDKLLNEKTDYSKLLNKEFCKKVVHLGSHWDIVYDYKPNSTLQLAMILAIIRPGKRHLIGKSFDEIEKEIWKRNTDGYVFKKSHAISYAILVELHIKLLCEQE